MSLTAVHGMSITVKADEALSANRLVGFGGAHTGAGEKSLGATDMAHEDTKPAKVIIEGVVILEAGDEVAVGDAVTSAANGKVVVVDTGDATNGYALSAASADGDLIAVKLV